MSGELPTTHPIGQPYHGPEMTVWSQDFGLVVPPLSLVVHACQIDDREVGFTVEVHPCDSRMSPREAMVTRSGLRELKDFLQFLVSNVRVEDERA